MHWDNQLGNLLYYWGFFTSPNVTEALDVLNCFLSCTSIKGDRIPKDTLKPEYPRSYYGMIKVSNMARKHLFFLASTEVKLWWLNYSLVQLLRDWLLPKLCVHALKQWWESVNVCRRTDPAVSSAWHHNIHFKCQDKKFLQIQSPLYFTNTCLYWWNF